MRTKKRTIESSESELKNKDDDILRFDPIENIPKKVDGAFGKEAELEKLRPLDRTGVIYIGHIPHGFYEEPMQKYFSQFGEVKNVVLCRSKKTGKSKGYAFVQFANDKVARIAAEATNGYALMEKVLKSHIVPPEKVSEDLFQFAGKKWKAVPWRKVVRDAQAAPKTEEGAQKRLARLTKREAEQSAKRRKLGIDFELEDSYEAQAKKRYGYIEDEKDDKEDEEDEEEVEDEKVKVKKGKREEIDLNLKSIQGVVALKRKRDVDVIAPSSTMKKASTEAKSTVPAKKNTVKATVVPVVPVVPEVPESSFTGLTAKSSSSSSSSTSLKSILKSTTTISSVTPKTTSTSSSNSVLPFAKKSILKK